MSGREMTTKTMRWVNVLEILITSLEALLVVKINNKCSTMIVTRYSLGSEEGENIQINNAISDITICKALGIPEQEGEPVSDGIPHTRGASIVT
jgi:hypothetical protein